VRSAFAATRWNEIFVDSASEHEIQPEGRHLFAPDLSLGCSQQKWNKSRKGWFRFDQRPARLANLLIFL